MMTTPSNGTTPPQNTNHNPQTNTQTIQDVDDYRAMPALASSDMDHELEPIYAMTIAPPRTSSWQEKLLIASLLTISALAITTVIVATGFLLYAGWRIADHFLNQFIH